MLIGNRARQLRLAIAVVALATFSVYLPTVLNAEFVGLDDGQYVVQNDLVRRPTFEGAWRFVREVWHPSTVAGYYQPLTMISLMGDSLLSGNEPSSMVFHLTNVLLHTFNAVLVLLIVRAACGGFVIPAAAALLWALHPIQVESVAWVGQRKTVLATCFALLAIRAHLLYGVSGAARWRWWTLLAYVLAGLAKPTVMFLPIVLLLLDVWPLRRTGARMWIEKWPLWIVMAATMVVAVRSQASDAGVGVPSFWALGGMARLIAYNTMLYVRHLLWPTDLCLFYSMPGNLDWSNPRILASLFVVVAGAAVWLSSWRWSRAVFVGLGAAGLQLVLAVGPVSFMQSQVGDRFMYLPLVLLVLPLAAGATRIWRRDGAGRRGAIGLRGAAVLAAALACVGLATSSTLGQQGAWVDSGRMWGRVLERIPDHPLASAGLAGVRLNDAVRMSDEGNTDEARAVLAEALDWVNRAIAAEPKGGANYETRAQIHLRMNRADEAVHDMRQALALDLGPMTVQGHVTLGRALIAAGRTDEACAAFDALLSSGKNVSLMWRLAMGKAFAEARRPEQALRYFEDAARMSPEDAEARQSLAASAAGTGRWEMAAEAYRRAIVLYARSGVETTDIELSLGKVLLELRQPDAAAKLFEKPGVARQFADQSHFGQAGVAALRGQTDTAFFHLKQAIALDPTMAGLATRKSWFDALHADARWAECVGAENAASQAASAPAEGRP